MGFLGFFTGSHNQASSEHSKKHHKKKKRKRSRERSRERDKRPNDDREDWPSAKSHYDNKEKRNSDLSKVWSSQNKEVRGSSSHTHSVSLFPFMGHSAGVTLKRLEYFQLEASCGFP